MTRQVLLSLIVILSVASLAVVGTYADFSDIETSEDNTFATAELNLRLENPGDVGAQEGESVLRTWHYELLKKNPDLPPWYGRVEPGEIISSYVYLQADSSNPVGHHVDIYCSNVNEELDMDTPIENAAEEAILGEPVDPLPNNGIYDKDTMMIITYMRYHTNPPIIWGEYDSYTYFTDMDGDNRISLDEFEKQPLIDLTPAPNDGTIMFTMDIKFAADAGNEYQGDRTNMTLMFALLQ